MIVNRLCKCHISLTGQQCLCIKIQEVSISLDCDQIYREWQGFNGRYHDLQFQNKCQFLKRNATCITFWHH